MDDEPLCELSIDKLHVGDRVRNMNEVYGSILRIDTDDTTTLLTIRWEIEFLTPLEKKQLGIPLIVKTHESCHAIYLA